MLKSAEAYSQYPAKNIFIPPLLQNRFWCPFVDDTIGKDFGVGVNSGIGCFLLKFKMAANMAENEWMFKKIMYS